MSKAVNGVAQDAPAFDAQLIFRVQASEIQSDPDPAVAGAMDRCKIAIDDTAQPDAAIPQAISELAVEWGIALA